MVGKNGHGIAVLQMGMEFVNKVLWPLNQCLDGVTMRTFHLDYPHTARSKCWECPSLSYYYTVKCHLAFFEDQWDTILFIHDFSPFLDHYYCLANHLSTTCNYIAFVYTSEHHIVTTFITTTQGDLERLYLGISFKGWKQSQIFRDETSRISWCRVSNLISNLIPSTI